MDREDKIAQMLDLMNGPAFCVREGRIVYANNAAARMGIAADTELAPLLLTGSLEYGEFTQGCLCLTLQTPAARLSVSVNRVDGWDVFLGEESDNSPELRALALAAQELRDPLANIMMTADHLFPAVASQAGENAQAHIARINRSLFQLLRIVSNMSDAHQYRSSQNERQQTVNITALVREIFEKADTLAVSAGVTVHYEGPRDQVYCLADPEKLERAIYNLLSNSMKYTPKGGSITASLTRRRDLLYLTVQDSGTGVPDALRANIHSRYLREPAIEDGRHGIGLGLTLVRAAAAAHGGTVLLEQPEGAGLKVTLTLRIRENTTGVLRAPILQVDYAGERDHGLMELCESLPSELYALSE